MLARNAMASFAVWWGGGGNNLVKQPVKTANYGMHDPNGQFSAPAYFYAIFNLISKEKNNSISLPNEYI